MRRFGLASLRYSAVSLGAAMLLSLALTPPAPAQNDVDLPVARLGRAMDTAYDYRGRLVVTFVEPDSVQDRIVVARSDDHGQTWNMLYQGPLGRVSRIVHLSLDLAYGYSDPAIDEKVFIGVVGEWDDRGRLYGFLGMLSGSYMTPWSAPQCEWIYTGGQAPPWPGMHGSIAVIPLQSPTDYYVGFAYTFPSRGDNGIQVAYSQDHGQTAKQTRFIAGAFGESIASSAEFGHPSLVADLNTRETVLAFDEGIPGSSSSKVHVLALDSRRHIERFDPLAAVYSTPPNRLCHSPVVAVYRGEINFTALAGQPHPTYWSFALTMFNGTTAAGFTEVFDPISGRTGLHPYAISAGDLQVRGNDGFITALCVTDPSNKAPGVGVIAFRSNVRILSEMTMEVVSDHPCSWMDPTVPKGAITPRGAAAIQHESQIYSTLGRGGDVWIDP